MMLHLLAALLMQDAAASSTVVETRVESFEVMIPVEISDLTMGYGDCLKTEIERRQSATPQAQRSHATWQIALLGGFDACRALRTEVARKANRALPGEYGSKRQRARIVEDALTSMEKGWGGAPAKNSETK
ncbi:MAG: hypothetical protein EOP61_04895 [Sphingomonadales bacterium]|nr:MAG: hypothetical protein EOP61_04895 [Sphingomonadales bacterium]